MPPIVVVADLLFSLAIIKRIIEVVTFDLLLKNLFRGSMELSHIPDEAAAVFKIQMLCP